MPEEDPDKEREEAAPPKREAAPGTVDRLISYYRGAKFPWWATLLLPFLIVLLFLYRAVKEEVNWKAAFATVGVFELVTFPAEIFSVSRGHWVYNDAKIWGPKLFNVPIEEPLLYYVFPALIMITAFHAIRMTLEKLSR